jgi:hypothetical protein
MPVILATQEAEIRRIAVQSQPGQMPITKKELAEWLKVCPEFKSQYCKPISFADTYLFPHKLVVNELQSLLRR